MKKYIAYLCMVAALLLQSCCTSADKTKAAMPSTPPPIGEDKEEETGDAVITPDNPDIDIKWVLDFEENFDGTEVNKDNWAIYDGPGHAGNGLRRPSAFSVSNGVLTITGETNKDGQIVSGGMAHKKNYLPIVKWEFRARCETDPSAAMSGVVLTWPQSEKWPDEGEMDIFETLNNASRRPLHTFLHYDATNKQVHKEYDVDASEWQEMALEWYSDALVIYLNGERMWTVTDKDVIPIWNHHICLQLDAFKTVLQAPVHMYVDYVRIYKGEIVKNG